MGFVIFCLLPGSALDLNFSDINVASLEKELEEQDNSIRLPSEDIDIFCCRNENFTVQCHIQC